MMRNLNAFMYHIIVFYGHMIDFTHFSQSFDKSFKKGMIAQHYFYCKSR